MAAAAPGEGLAQGNLMLLSDRDVRIAGLPRPEGTGLAAACRPMHGVGGRRLLHWPHRFAQPHRAVVHVSRPPITVLRRQQAMQPSATMTVVA
jgi:hypothetical protein